MKNEILDQQRDLERHGKQLEYEKNFIDLTSKNQNELGKLNENAETNLLKMKEERLIFESQRLDLMSQTKKLQRKITELEEHLKELTEQHNEVKVIFFSPYLKIL